jgi:hypothetical protein
LGLVFFEIFFGLENRKLQEKQKTSHQKEKPKPKSQIYLSEESLTFRKRKKSSHRQKKQKKKAKNRKQKTENRKQKTENRKQKTENRKQKTENRKSYKKRPQILVNIDIFFGLESQIYLSEENLTFRKRKKFSH